MSEVSICNQALGWLGEQTIISLDDDTRPAQLCKANYAPLRDAVTEAHNWTFASRRYELPQLLNSPVFYYAQAYAIPTEVLRVREVNRIEAKDGTFDWQIEEVDGLNAIVINSEICRILAISQVTDTKRFTNLYTQALAARIAADLAIPLTNSRQMQADMWGIYQVKLKEAAALDGSQGKSRRMRSFWLNRARIDYGGTSEAGPVV